MVLGGELTHGHWRLGGRIGVWPGQFPEGQLVEPLLKSHGVCGLHMHHMCALFEYIHMMTRVSIRGFLVLL